MVGGIKGTHTGGVTRGHGVGLGGDMETWGVTWGDMGGGALTISLWGGGLWWGSRRSGVGSARGGLWGVGSRGVLYRGDLVGGGIYMGRVAGGYGGDYMGGLYEEGGSQGMGGGPRWFIWGVGEEVKWGGFHRFNAGRGGYKM